MGQYYQMKIQHLEEKIDANNWLASSISSFSCIPNYNLIYSFIKSFLQALMKKFFIKSYDFHHIETYFKFSIQLN